MNIWFLTNVLHISEFPRTNISKSFRVTYAGLFGVFQKYKQICCLKKSNLTKWPKFVLNRFKKFSWNPMDKKSSHSIEIDATRVHFQQISQKILWTHHVSQNTVRHFLATIVQFLDEHESEKSLESKSMRTITKTPLRRTLYDELFDICKIIPTNSKLLQTHVQLSFIYSA